MLYLIDEYAEKYPNRTADIQFIKKFEGCEKYLHEMTANEITSIVNSWGKLAPQTEYIRKRNLANYFKFLQENGARVVPNVNNISFPIAEREHNIYSTKDIAHYYDILFKELEKNAALTGKTFDKSTYLMSYASGILAFCGIEPEQILKLSLSDITPDGVNGYNLFLTREDIEILLAYKNLSVTANRMRLVGDKYIRTTLKTKGEINVRYLMKPIWRVELDEEHTYLRTLLSVHTLYKFGIFNRIYQYEKANNVFIKPRIATPDWFIKITQADNMSDTEISLLRGKYYQYREERNGTQQAEEESDVVVPIVQATEFVNSNQDNNNSSYNYLIDKLSQAYMKINEALAIINEVQKELVKTKK